MTDEPMQGGEPLREAATGPGTDGALLQVHPWVVREDTVDIASLARSESVFALSNGHLGVRGTLDEGEPRGLPGSYLNSVYETRPLPYAEAGYGYPESGQTVVGVTNGTLIRLLVDDEPFDVRYGTLYGHVRELDLRAGVLRRVAKWSTPTGKRVEIRSTRLVSLTHRSVLAVEYVVQAIDPVRVVLQSELVTDEEVPTASADPRAAAALRAPFVPVEHSCAGTRLHLQHRTRASGIEVAVEADHILDSSPEVSYEVHGDCRPDWARTTVASALGPGQELRLVKIVSYGWSSIRSTPALRDQVAAGLSGALRTGWEGLVQEQRAVLDEFWAGADVQVEGDRMLQQAVRFGLFHVLQSAIRAEGRPIPAKGLTGPGYDGHTFWDTEAFVLPVLAHTWPDAVADALRFRHGTLPQARARAKALRLRGATFPWRTINGDECSAYWPAGTAAFHVNAAVADAVVRYHDARHDPDFSRGHGVELLVETARLWLSLGHFGADGQFRIEGVTGPDEYSAVADNNVYTNLMAARNLRAAAEAVRRTPRAVEGVSDEEVADWERAAGAVRVPYDDRLGVHPQSDGFTDQAVWDFAGTPPEEYPLLLHHSYVQLYRHQVVKQADLVLAMQLRGDAFTPEQKARNFQYYEALTVRDSSLSAAPQAVLAAEVGALDLAYAYACEAAFVDLHDVDGNTGDGLHMASLAGAWMALVAGFGGFRDHDGVLAFAPRLPAGLARLAFTIRHRGRRLAVETDGQHATYTLLDDGESLVIRHHGAEVAVGETPVTAPVPPPPVPPPLTQPPGREPRPPSAYRHLADQPPPADDPGAQR